MKTALIILDGWGIGNAKKSDAIANSKKPFFDSLIKNNTHATLKTFGYNVGLPNGQMGNSEVGHLNIGAGRVVYQELARINKDIEDNLFFENETILNTINYCKSNPQASLHLMGLVSDGGVHSHINHLKALCTLIKNNNISNCYIHAFLDGRDTDPKSGKIFIHSLLKHIENTTIQLASVIGRYYAMDRDKRWERIKIAYDCLVNRKGNFTNDFLKTVGENYDSKITDEFLLPILNENVTDNARIKTGDAVICFNFRTDRCREITEVLTQQDMPALNMFKLNLKYTTFTKYDQSYKNVEVVYTKENLENPLGKVIALAGKTQLRIAETEKYPHVTFFFNGGEEQLFIGEERIMIPSPKVATYDLQPSMSAVAITNAVVENIEQKEPDFICLNFANTDMVGHTGVYTAVQEAVNVVDTCLQQVVVKALAHNYSILVIADHGNADFMINEDGSPNTAHTTNLVPIIAINVNGKIIQDGVLADVAPTILACMQLEKPIIMTGKNLLK